MTEREAFRRLFDVAAEVYNRTLREGEITRNLIRDRELIDGALADALYDAKQTLETECHKSGTNDAERRLRELARIVDMAEGFDGRFGSEVAAEHEMAAISEAFVAARKEGADSYEALCRALDVGSEGHKPRGC